MTCRRCGHVSDRPTVEETVDDFHNHACLYDAPPDEYVAYVARDRAIRQHHLHSRLRGCGPSSPRK